MQNLKSIVVKFHFSKYFIVIPLIFYLALRLPGLSTDMTNSDGWRWHTRSEKFYAGLKSGNFVETYQRYHPGITLMWLTSGVTLGIKAYDRLSGEPFRSLENVEGYLLIDGACKIALVLVLFALLVIQYTYISKLFGHFVGFWYVLLVSVEPYLVGISRWYHLTALEAFLSFCSLLAILYWRKTQSNRELVLCGIFSGLALLTKFSSVTVLIFVAVVITLTLVSKSVKQMLIALAIVGSVTFVVVVALFPALWTNASYVIGKLTSAGENAVAGEYGTVLFAKNYPWLFYPFVIYFKLSPVTLVLLVLTLWQVRKSRDFNLLILLACVFFNLVFFSLSAQKIERYLVSFLLPVLLLIAVYLNSLGSKLKHAIVALVIMVGIYLYFVFYPFLSLYYSPVFGGIAKAANLGLIDTNGEYFAQAAFYLNQKGREVHVLVPGDTRTFTPYFKGKLDGELSPLTEYAVVSYNSKTYSGLIPGCSQVEKTFSLEGVKLVSVLKCQH